MVVASSKSSKRLELTVTSEQESLFQKAADIRGVTVEEFILASLEAEAVNAIRLENDSTIKLSPQDSLIFAEAILNPREPNEALRNAAREYRKWVAEVDRE